MTTITLNGKTLEVADDLTLLDAAKLAGIDIPTLCHHPSLGAYGACRVCVVEASGPGLRTGLNASCTMPVSNGMVVNTENAAVQQARKLVFELLLGHSPDSTELQEIAARYGVTESRFGKGSQQDKCVRCGLCVRACREKIGVAAISFAERGQHRLVTTEFGDESSLCIGCGSCATVCPTAMVRVHDHDGQREILRGEHVVARFALLNCTECSVPVVNAKFLDNRMEGLSEAYSEVLCPECKRLRAATAAGNFPDIWS
jgi:NADH dehydrogenase/NADH:ubiquinone oxidoreductase subunit G